MKVLLKEDVEALGYAGEVYKVAPGYGRNYLIPKGLAVQATPSALKQAEIWRRKAETRRAELRAEYEALAARVAEVKLTFHARASESGRLYGSVTMNQITDAMNEMLGTEIDRRKVAGDPLRQLGTHKVQVRLSGEFHPEVTVVIASEESEKEAAEPVEQPTEEPAETAVAEAEA